MANRIRMSDSRTIRAATARDAEAIESTAVAAEMFSTEEAGFLGEMLRAACGGESPGAHWLVLEDDARGVVGAAYYAPEPFADRMWNLYFIAVAPADQGSGAGTQLMAHVEASLRSMGPEQARTLVVDSEVVVKTEYHF